MGYFKGGCSMRLAVACAALGAFISAAHADTYVRGHYRSDGTYVQPHYRTKPDSYQFNNYSHQGNVNPYTGRVGTQDWKPRLSPGGSYGINNLNRYGR